MNTYRVGARVQGKKAVFEVDNVSSYAFARDFVMKETKADVVLALVQPVEKTIFEEPENLIA